MPVHAFISKQLTRDLTAKEREVLRRLSPQGVAKLNRDISNGIPIATTLNDLVSVFEQLQKRRQALESALSNDDQVRELIQKLGRPPTTDELMLFVTLPTKNIVAQVRQHIMRGDSYGSIVEDMAVQLKYDQLRTDAAAFSEKQALPTRLLLLSPTLRPSDSRNALSPNMAQFSGKKITIGISPLLSWFREDGFLGCDDLDNRTGCHQMGDAEIPDKLPEKDEFMLDSPLKCPSSCANEASSKAFDTLVVSCLAAAVVEALSQTRNLKPESLLPITTSIENESSLIRPIGAIPPSASAPFAISPRRHFDVTTPSRTTSMFVNNNGIPTSFTTGSLPRFKQEESPRSSGEGVPALSPRPPTQRPAEHPCLPILSIGSAPSRAAPPRARPARMRRFLSSINPFPRAHK